MAYVLSMAKKVAVITALVEGCSVRSTSRMTGVAKGTILRLLETVGKACADYQNVTLRNIPAKRVQVDEIWSFCYAKAKNATAEMWKRVGYAGDVWTFAAIDADTKLVISWLVGGRDAGCAADFLQDVASRLSNRIQLTTDGHKMYLTAVPDAFGNQIDYAQLVKVFGNDPEGQKRYSPAQCLGTKRVEVIGKPDQDHISTSYVERQNLTMRMQMRRFTRLTNAFSKKIDNHMHQVALFYMWYNFGRIHQTLRVTPAMEGGISSHVWAVSEIVALATSSRVLAA
ncbi:MAG TPA: IS1 family transposase [Bryobacteraceae bacterium]|nr:IS1 family transposase [Bryobacteraceae bacterium]